MAAKATGCMKNPPTNVKCTQLCLLAVETQSVQRTQSGLKAIEVPP